MIFTAETVISGKGAVEDYAKLSTFEKVLSMMEQGKTDGNRKVPVPFTFHRYWVDRAAAEEFLQFALADMARVNIEVVSAVVNDIEPTDDPYKNEVFYAVGEMPNFGVN